MAHRDEMLKAIKQQGDDYGNGAHSLIALMKETGHIRLPDVTDGELVEFCKRHRIEVKADGETSNHPWQPI